MEDMEPAQESGIQSQAPEPDRAPASSPSSYQPTGPMEEPEQSQPNETVQVAPHLAEPSTMDKVGVAVKQAISSTPVNPIWPFNSDQDQGFAERAVHEYLANNTGPKLTPDELNKQFPGMDVPFSQNETAASAKIKWDHNQYQKKLADFATYGDPLPWTAKVAIGLGVNVFNPANIAAFAGAGALAGIGEGAGLLETAAHSLSTMGVLEYAGFKQAKNEQENPSIAGAVENTIIGGAVGTGLHFALDALGDFSKASKETLQSVPKDVLEANAKTALAQSESNARIDLTEGHAIAQARINGDLEGQNSPYRFTPMQHPSDRSMYGASSGSGEPSNVHGTDLGPGRALTDDGVQANNHVPDGLVGEFHLKPEQKFLDVEQSASSPEIKQFHDAIESKLGGETKLDIQPDESIKDVLSRLGEMAESGDAPHDILSQVQEIAKQEGFEGFKGVQETPDGSQKNFVHLFDDKAMPTNIYDSNPDIVPKVQPDQIQQTMKDAQRPENGAFSTPEIQKDVHDLRHGPSLNSNSTPDYLDPIVKEKYDSAMQQLQTLAKESPEIKEQLEGLKRLSATDAQEKATLEKFADCVTGSIA